MQSHSFSQNSLYERLGGESLVEVAVEIFYMKVIEDDRVSHFFRWTNMETQFERQKAFLTYVFGGPRPYTGRDLNLAHAHLRAYGLKDSHFDIVVEHLIDSLKDLGVDFGLIEEVMLLTEEAREDVMGRR
ncbi:MAG: group 1 truncated hemoglobin [Bacteroidota bacterium]